MNRRRSILFLAAGLAALLLSLPSVSRSNAAPPLTPLEQLGKDLCFDTNLSTPPGQSCAACHAPEVGWTGPISEANAASAVYAGAVHTRFGNRKPPTSAYAGDSPILHYDENEGVWVGGTFWDGRATGWRLGDGLAEQAQGPFLNPLEQNNPDASQVVGKVARASYADLYEQVWGDGALTRWMKNTTLLYERIARSIAGFERSPESTAFTSKYDYFLKGEATLTPAEQAGLDLFSGPIAKCSACHPAPLFTDFTYDNLGIPRNPANPFYTMPRKWNPEGANWVDPGLGGFPKSAGYAPAVYESEMGKFKVPTLRNVDLRPAPGFVKAFGHNGYFKSLESIVHFYNTRDVPGAGWPAPEMAENVNTTELGNLGLTAEQEGYLVAFMKTLSDGYTP